MGITTINNQLAITIDPNKMKSKRVKRVNTIETLITNSDKGITFLEPERYEELSGELALLEFIDELEHLLFAIQRSKKLRACEDRSKYKRHHRKLSPKYHWRFWR